MRASLIERDRQRLNALRDVKAELLLAVDYWRKPIKGVSPYPVARHRALVSLVKHMDDQIEDAELQLSRREQAAVDTPPQRRKPRIRYTNYFGLGGGPITKIGE